MKYVCRQTCQVRIRGKITLCNKGGIYNLEEPNARFDCIEPEAQTYEVDFLKASKEELREAKWKFSDAKAAIKEAYDVSIHKEEGTTRMNVIDQILDARYRAIDVIPTPKLK